MTYLRDSDREALRLAHDLREEMRVWLASRGTNAPLSVSPFVDPGGQPSVLVTMSADVARALSAMLAELRGPAPGRPGLEAGIPRQAGDTGGLPALGDSGGFRTVNDTGGFRPVHDTGGFRPVHDTGGFRPVHETGGLPAVHESGGFPAVRDTGSVPAVHDTGGFQRIHDTGGLHSVGHGVPQAHAPALPATQPAAGPPHPMHGTVNGAVNGVANGAPTTAGLPQPVPGTGGFPQVADAGYRTPAAPAVPAAYQQGGYPPHR